MAAPEMHFETIAKRCEDGGVIGFIARGGGKRKFGGSSTLVCRDSHWGGDVGFASRNGTRRFCAIGY
jgi:hypothetical protein